MAVKRYDGSQWVTVAGKGDQGTSSSIATWVKTASGGETSVSGNDDNSQPLSYTVGQELVFINGALQKRGSDYTATTGNSITGLTALAANDVVTVWTVNAFSVTGAIANTIVDAKGDILVGTGADTPGRLAVGTNGQYLKADSTAGTGLAWATLPSSGKVLQVVFADYATETVVASTTYTDVGLTATITPSAATSKILILGNIAGYAIRTTTNQGYAVRILRGSTVIYTPDGSSYNFHSGYIQSGGATNVEIATRAYHHYLDSPNTTSATTYKFQGRCNNTANSGSVTFQLGASNTYSSVVLMEIGA